MNDDADLPKADHADSSLTDPAAQGESVSRLDADTQPDEDPQLDAKGISRRQMLTRSVAVMGGAIAAGVGIPAIFYVAGPAAEDSGTAEWIRLGAASSVEPGTPTLMKANVERRSGYLTSTEELSVFVTTENGTSFEALSNVCSHLGCRVRWVDEQDGFFCPCHNAVFNADGTVASGPPPRPLDQFEVKVEESQIFIKGIA